MSFPGFPAAALMERLLIVFNEAQLSSGRRGADSAETQGSIELSRKPSKEKAHRGPQRPDFIRPAPSGMMAPCADDFGRH
jgi:hypothetical protein